jgi:hypothetical protein
VSPRKVSNTYGRCGRFRRLLDNEDSVTFSRQSNVLVGQVSYSPQQPGPRAAYGHQSGGVPFGKASAQVTQAFRQEDGEWRLDVRGWLRGHSVPQGRGSETGAIGWVWKTPLTAPVPASGFHSVYIGYIGAGRVTVARLRGSRRAAMARRND